MWLDVMSQYNSLAVNIKLANVLGLHTAVYWAELLNVYARVIKKFKDLLIDNEGYFELDREYVKERTTLDIEEQLKIDAGLKKLNVLSERENDPNWIKLDVERFCALLVDDDIDAIRNMQKTSKLGRDDQARAKKNCVRMNLVAVLSETDKDVLEAYKVWIDAMLEAKKPLTRAAVEIYQRNLNDYTDSKDVKIKILEIATSLAYHEFAWARDQFEKNYRGSGTFIRVKQRKSGGIDPNSGF